MTPQMVEALYQISLLYAPEPETVFERIVETVAKMYGDTMTMVTLTDDKRIRLRMVANKHPLFGKRDSIPKSASLCQFSMRSKDPLLVQNAEMHPDFCGHGVVGLKLRRYLGVPVCNAGGEPIGTFCILDDRTDEILTDQDVQFFSLLAMRVSAELERERLIEARIAEQRVHAERLMQTAKEKREFVSMVIHDLRHPLTTMRTCLHLLEIETDRNQRRAHLKALENRTRALSALLDELTLYDQIEAGRPLLKIEDVDLAALICGCVAEVGGLCEGQTVPIHYDIAPDVGTAHIDGGKLKHILMNLIANALKFTAEGCVTVRVRRESDDEWRLEVEDTGVGMTETERHRAFEEYFSGGAASGGVGLGLTIARRLCHVLNGRVTLQSVPGVGTRFHLVFPYRFARRI